MYHCDVKGGRNMNYKFMNRGVCSRSVSFDITDGIITNIKFEGGCNGNTKGIAALAEGMNARECAEKLKGIRCGFKDTSCPDQLANAINHALSEQKD